MNSSIGRRPRPTPPGRGDGGRCAGQSRGESERLAAPLSVRGSLPADVFQPFGREDSVALASYLARKRVPAWRRPLTPLLVAGTDIAWVAGVEIGDFCRVRPESRRLLELSLEYRDGRPERPPTAPLADPEG